MHSGSYILKSDGRKTTIAIQIATKERKEIYTETETQVRCWKIREGKAKDSQHIALRILHVEEVREHVEVEDANSNPATSERLEIYTVTETHGRCYKITEGKGNDST